MPFRGFILQTTHRIERRRPVIHVYGKLEDGRSFLVRESRRTPGFWIRATDRDSASALGLTVRDPVPARSTMAGAPVARVELALPGEAMAAHERLRRHGIETHEADVRITDGLLIDRSIRGAVEIEGHARPGRGIDVVFDDPELSPTQLAATLTPLSIDIETDPSARRILSVALVGCGAQEVLLVSPGGDDAGHPAAVSCRDERELLERFARRVIELDPDVITGWNVIDFDLFVMSRRAKTLGVDFGLGRDDRSTRVLRATERRGSGRVFVTGRVVLDGIDLLRGAFVRMESYALDAVAREVLGEGKTITGADRAAEILRQFREDRASFVEYNLRDARLVLRILDRLRLVPLAVERSRLTGMPPDRVSASIASFDFLYLSELHRRGIVAPTLDATHRAPIEAGGGQVLDPSPGLYRNVIVLDFRSLYPSVIRTFQIDPLGRLEEPADEPDPIVAPNGAAFRRQPGILPALLDELFPRRAAAKAAGDAVTSQAIKILMNSFYGVLGTTACRFASAELANAITGFGRETLLWAKAFIETRGHVVLYGDTDSLFVLSGTDDPAEAGRVGNRLVREVNRSLAEHLERRYGVQSRLEIEFERLYLRMLLPRMRGGRGGARKRYAGLVDGAGVVFTGMEVVRRDWTRLARDVQRELYERLFSDRPVDDYLRAVVNDLRAGRLDDRLVYRKALRKRLAEYTASTPPHVAAARKLDKPPRRRVSYVITIAGAEPVGHIRSPLDHEHYVQRQIRPVAEPVLELLGLDFDRVVGDEIQPSLF